LYGGYLVIQDQMTIGALVAFSAYQSRAFNPLQVLLDLYLRIERAGVSLERIFEFLDVKKEQEEWQSGPRCPADLRGTIEFREVSFAYEANTPVLKEVSFRVAAGERLTILGPSGTGKTTVVDLLARLYEPDSGLILLDEHNVQEYDLTWLRRQIVVVSHEPILFHASLVENLRYASPDASVDEVSAAAQLVGLHPFITSLPQGYETVVGERGARLSAGQKQRIALARAVLKQPKILVLDEALSGLDVMSEAGVREALATFMAGRTTILITHRLSSLHAQDTVMMVNNGQVVWQGQYSDLATSSLEVQAVLRDGEARSPNLSPQS
jgi:ABC-type bacteriocin/lantibiotic exporter with double-glycine peptidase domain